MIIPYISRPPRNPPLSHKAVEEHGVEQPLRELALREAAAPHELRLVEGEDWGRVDADHCEAVSGMKLKIIRFKTKRFRKSTKVLVKWLSCSRRINRG